MKKATLKLTCALLISLPACASHVMVKDAHFNEGAVLSEDTSKDFWWPKHPQSKKNTNPDRMNLIDDGTLGVGDKIQLEYSRVANELAPLKAGDRIRAHISELNTDNTNRVLRGIRSEAGSYEATQMGEKVLLEFAVGPEGKMKLSLDGDRVEKRITGFTWIAAQNKLKKEIGDLVNGVVRESPTVEIQKGLIGNLLAENDEIEIVVGGLPEGVEPLTATSVVIGGNIRFHPIGNVFAHGKSLDEIQEEIFSKLRESYSQAIVTVKPVKFEDKAKQFMATLVSGELGTVRDFTVWNEGHISVPGLNESIEVRGQLPKEIENTINDKLAQSLGPISVSLTKVFDANASFSIVGEIEKPGSYPIEGPVTLVEALATAGWGNDWADLERVVLIKKIPRKNEREGEKKSTRKNESESENDPPSLTSFVRLYDVYGALHHGSGLPNVFVDPEDVVLVPRTDVGNLNAWVEQYIRNNMPVPFGTSYRVGS
ncbi:MAG: polysaccharide biosynthesis/export family protein [Planctomycetota bacterium]|nr:polysaccharide biosynthesis/export family protein [Planctomycetota bacterium]